MNAESYLTFIISTITIVSIIAFIVSYKVFKNMSEEEKRELRLKGKGKC